MYAKAPYTVIRRAVHIHPTVSELVPTIAFAVKHARRELRLPPRRGVRNAIGFADAIAELQPLAIPPCRRFLQPAATQPQTRRHLQTAAFAVKHGMAHLVGVTFAPLARRPAPDLCVSLASW
jgi:hypothetical protein